MVEENRHPEPPSAPENPPVLYEHSDASFRWVLGLLIVAAILGVIIHFAILSFYHRYEDSQAKIKASRFPLADSSSHRLPPEPRLEQVNRMEDIQSGNVRLREETKEAILRSYGPAGAGHVHIPIDRAMDLLADKLESRKEQPSAEEARRQNGLVDAGEPNSGRMFRGQKP